MKKIILILCLMFSTSVFAETITWVTAGTFHILTLDNMREDQIPSIPSIQRQKGDVGLVCMNEATGEQFFVLIRKDKMSEYDKGQTIGYASVKMNARLLTVYNKMKIYEFINWFN